MKLDNVFKTRTMARVLASQGQIKKAKSIYNYLIKQNPHQEELKAELKALNNRQLTPKDPNEIVDLNLLYHKWIETAFSYYRKNNA